MRALAVEVAARWAVRPHTASSFHDASRNASPLAAGAGGAGRTSSVMRRSSWASSSGTLLSKRSCTTCRGTDRAAEAVMGPIRSARARQAPGLGASSVPPRGVGSPGCAVAGRRGGRRGGRAQGARGRTCSVFATCRRASPDRRSCRGGGQRAARRALFGRRLWAQALGAGFGRAGEGWRKACERVWGDEGGCARMGEAPGGRAHGWRRARRRGRAGARSPAAGCAQTLTLASAARSVPRHLPAGPQPWPARRGAARRGGLRCGAGLHLGALALARGHEGAHAALAHLDALPARRVDALGRRTRQHHIQKVGPAALAPCHSAPRHKPPQQTFLS